MNGQSVDIQKLLEDLRSDDAYRRRLAAETIGQQKITDERTTDLLKSIALHDPNAMVRSASRSALNNLGIDFDLPSNEPMSLPKSVKPLSRNEKIRDFLIGFVGWYTANGLTWYALGGGSNNNGEGILANIFIFPVNLLALIILSATKRTRWIGFGILAALCLNLVLSLIVGMSINGFCFVPFYVK